MCSDMAVKIRKNDLPPVTRFILDALAVTFGAAPPLPPAGLDWDQVLKGVVYHRVPLLLSAFEQSIPLPEPVHARLKAVQKGAAIRTLALTAAVVEAVGACRAAGIRTVLLKGAAHSVLFFGRPDRRWSRDIDLLTHPHDRAAALRVLGGLGYDIVKEDREASTVHRRQDGVVIELHCALDMDERLLPLPLLRPFDGTREVMLGGCPVETLNPEKSIVYAAFHGTKHLWIQYFWLCDIAAARQWGNIDWAEALAIARTAGVDRHLLLACTLAEAYLGVTSPLHGLVSPKEADRARWFAGALHPVLADEDFDHDGAPFRRLGRMRYLWWDICLQRRASARWAALVWPWRPSDRDRRFVSLPGPLRGLYPVIRLCRVLWDARRRRRSR